MEVLRRLTDRPALFVQALGPVRRVRKLAGHEMLAGHAIEHEVIAVAGRLHHQLAGPAVELPIEEHRRLRGVPVVRVVWRGRVVPRQLARVDVDRDEGAGVQVVALTPGLRGI